jgi:hypothetical protein
VPALAAYNPRLVRLSGEAHRAPARKPRWIACKTAELINHVRNNMFYGAKAPGDAADRELVEHINVLMLESSI